MTVPDAIRRKALSVLREGRLTVLSARSDTDTLTVQSAMVRVQGSRGVYVVDFQHGEWHCTCTRGQAGVRCGHIVAAQLITGHAEQSQAVAS